SDLPLRRCKGIRFVDHHHSYCNKQGTCADLHRSAADAGAELLGKLIGANERQGIALFESTSRGGKVESSVESALSKLYRQSVAKFDSDNPGGLDEGTRPEVMKWILMAAALGQEARMKKLLQLFPTKAAAEATFDQCI